MTTKEHVTNFTDKRSLFLETADYREFAHPYAPHHPNAVGRVNKLIDDGSGHGIIPLGYVKKIIEPDLPNNENLPIEINSQVIDKERKVIVLEGKVKYGTHPTNRKTGPISDETHLKLELYLESVLD